jgi:Uma2 family endonuclease
MLTRPNRRDDIVRMATAAGPYTIEMLDRFPRDGKRYEILDGVLLVTPAPNPLHQRVQARLGPILAMYVDGHGLGQLYFGPSDVIFDEHTLFEPDLLVALGDEARRMRSWRELPDPALAVEILSPSSARYDRGAKRERYLTRCAEYWIVDIEARLVECWRAGDERPTIHRDVLEWQPDSGVPALRVEVPLLFSDLPEGE